MTREQIEEIAGDLELGMRCFVHRHSKEIVSFPDQDRIDLLDTDDWDEIIAKVDSARDSYVELEWMEFEGII